MRPVELADPGFGEPKRTNLALINEVGHRAPGLLNRNRGIHAVELVQVDDVNPEPAQGAVDPRPNVLRTPVIRHAEGRGVLEDEPDLGRHAHVVAAPGDRRSDESFVVVGAVDVGRVDQVYPEVDGAPDDARRPVVVAVTRPVGAAHSHAPEPDGPDLPSGRAEMVTRDVGNGWH